MSRYSYAQLGSNCRESMDVLVSNAKYLPPSDPVYNEFLTQMYQYPSTEKPYCQLREEKDKPKKPNLVLTKIPKPGGGCSSCC